MTPDHLSHRARLRHRRGRVSRGTGALVAGLLVLAAACSDDDDGGESGAATTPAGTFSEAADTVAPDGTDATDANSAGTGTTDDAEEADATDDANEGGGEVSGDPVKVMTTCPVDTPLPPYPAQCETATVYEQWVNDNGGIAGRPLEVITCDDKGDVNETAACARQAVDEEVVAVVGSFTWDVSLAIPIVEEAGIAWFGSPFAAVPPEYASPVSFPFGTLFPQPAGGVIKMLDDGCERPVFVLQDVAYGQVVQGIAAAVFERSGFDPSDASFVFVSPESQDYTAQAAEAVEGDCINSVLSEVQWGQWVTALQSVGLDDQQLYGPQGNLTQGVVDQFPDVLEGATIVSHYPAITDPAWDDFRSALDTYEHEDHDFNSLVGLGGWAAYTAFTRIAADIEGDVTAESFLAAASETTDLDLGGMLPPLDLSTDWDGLGGAYPRALVRAVYFDSVVDGQVVAGDGEATEYDDLLEEPIEG